MKNIVSFNEVGWFDTDEETMSYVMEYIDKKSRSEAISLQSLVEDINNKFTLTVTEVACAMYILGQFFNEHSKRKQEKELCN